MSRIVAVLCIGVTLGAAIAQPPRPVYEFRVGQDFSDQMTESNFCGRFGFLWATPRQCNAALLDEIPTPNKNKQYPSTWSYFEYSSMRPGVCAVRS